MDGQLYNIWKMLDIMFMIQLKYNIGSVNSW